MDKETRNLIFNTTQAMRRLLEEEFSLQLEGTFDVHPDGRVAEVPGPNLTPGERLVRHRIVEAIQHHRASGKSDLESVRAYLSETVFTFLNRLAALKMMEARALVLPCVSQGDQSQGFKEFSGLAPGLIELPDKGYRLYLECLFDEIGREVGILFDRTDAASQLWPRRKAFEAALEKLNHSSLARVWAEDEDETIGWIYQYYNDPAERKQMRDESAAPRNSRELAVRNQFFTPRYVVEFLTDNSLGRLWYEMTKGRTRLKEDCRYMIRRPIEIFLDLDESEPKRSADRADKETLSQQEMLKQPVHIPYRELKDPREIRMLDPACGSMHFGLYAFDLFETIYAEAWDFAHAADSAAKSVGAFAPFVAFAASFSGREAFLREVPRLTIEHNIHGIDIDPRAAQIAGLSLWLRAQRSWRDMRLQRVERPSIRRSNIVCAEPMPGERELLDEFVESQFPSAERELFRQLLGTVWDSMKLAGEAGSLLKIEEEITSAIDRARDASGRLRNRPRELFTTDELNEVSREPQLTGLDLAVTQLEPGEDFWERIEERIYTALRTFAEQAENGDGFRRRLFVEDAARGFAFIDICRQRYDVALMNPPFGDASIPSRAYIDDTYGDTKGDVYKAFVECFHARLVPAGYLGIISSRNGFLLSASEDWRTRVVLRLFRPVALADLGSGVLDAMVEVAAYVLRSLSAREARDLTLSIVPVLENVARDRQDRFSLPKWQDARGGLKRHQAIAELEHLEAHGFVHRSPGDNLRFSPQWLSVKKVTAPNPPAYPYFVCIRLLEDSAKDSALLASTTDQNDARRFISNPGGFSAIPGCPFTYWVSNRVRGLFRELQPFASEGRESGFGIASGADIQWLRLSWEVPPNAQGRSADDSTSTGWVILSKGGEFATFYPHLHVVINWTGNGELISSWKIAQLAMGRITANNSKCWNRSKYFRRGLTWSRRSQKGLSVRMLPDGCIFGDKGPGAFAPNDNGFELECLVAILNSTAFRGLVALQMAFGSYEVGVIQRTVLPDVDAESKSQLSSLARTIWLEKRRQDSATSTSLAFYLPAMLNSSELSLIDQCRSWIAGVQKAENTFTAIKAEIDDLAFRLYGLDPLDRAALTSTLATCSLDTEAGEDEEEEDAASADAPALTADLLAYALGCAFGRWDIRYANGERPAPPAPDPFAPLPVCPPGMLQNADGLPATPSDFPAGYPLRISWSGILVDDRGHDEDIETRLTEVFGVIWQDRADFIIHEACELLGVKSLRDYFRKPTEFFAHHLKRHSKSRRQAPIYWPLTSPAGLYTVWLYYPRLTPDTLFAVLRDYVAPKLQFEERRAFELRQAAGPTPGPAQRRDIAEADDLVADLRAMRDELQRVAPLFRPDLNDGVILNYAPLWRMIALPKWRKDCLAAWNTLCKGEYDWAHLALHLWPERVIPKCANDRSLSIALGLEQIFWEPDPEKPAKFLPRSVPTSEVESLIATHTSPAVKAALNSLLSAPTPSAKSKRGQKR